MLAPNKKPVVSDAECVECAGLGTEALGRECCGGQGCTACTDLQEATMLAPHKKPKPLPADREPCLSCTDGALSDGTWCSRCEGMGAIEVCEDCGAEMRGAKRCPCACGWCGDHACKIDSHAVCS